MTKIKIKFSTGYEVLATVQEKDDPEFAANLMAMVNKGPIICSCYHTISTGRFYLATPRPPEEPVKAGTQADAIGNVKTLVSDLEAGDISLVGCNFWVTWGACTEPVPIGGPVVAKVDPEYIDDFVKAGREVWMHDYIYHKLSTLTICKEDA